MLNRLGSNNNLQPQPYAELKHLDKSNTDKNSILSAVCKQENADIVVTDTYSSMGMEDEKSIRKKIFAPFCINKSMFDLAKKDAIFLHCLPAYRGDEVTSEVIDGKNSVIFDEAENRLHANKGILAWLQNNK